jgi:protein-L-isoaspartate O-methyltransferase
MLGADLLTVHVQLVLDGSGHPGTAAGSKHRAPGEQVLPLATGRTQASGVAGRTGRRTGGPRASMSNVAPRIRWSVEQLDVQPDDRLLEVGCGHGVAVSLVCQTLGGGTIHAIDRSPVAGHAIARAAHRRDEPQVGASEDRY